MDQKRARTRTRTQKGILKVAITKSSCIILQDHKWQNEKAVRRECGYHRGHRSKTIEITSPPWISEIRWPPEKKMVNCDIWNISVMRYEYHTSCLPNSDCKDRKRFWWRDVMTSISGAHVPGHDVSVCGRSRRHLRTVIRGGWVQRYFRQFSLS